MNDIEVDKYLKSKNMIAIDVRSPIEFDEGSIPDALNIPLFTNEERKEIGTIYKHIGTEAAKWKAMEVVSPKIPGMLERIRALKEGGNEPVVYCWRGGMRSKSVAMFAELSGLKISRISGGYRAYRERILELTPGLIQNKKAIVLHGMTGAGKTLILHHLKKQGYPILDLEGIANHRGSVFGAFGEWCPSNQKTFDALLYKELKQIQSVEYFLMEAESKRIGHATQPDWLLEAKENGLQIHVDAPMEARIERTYEEYVTPFHGEPWFQERLSESLGKITKRLKNPVIHEEIEKSMKDHDYRKLIELLYEFYYDPRYFHSEKNYFTDSYTVNASSIEEASLTIEDILKKNGFYAADRQV